MSEDTKKKEGETNNSKKEVSQPVISPIIPTCDRCGQLLTRCVCQHNVLKK